MHSQPRRPAFVWLVVLLCGVYAGFFAFTTYVSARSYGLVKDRGWLVRATDTGWIVTDVDEAGAAAGRLERGDRVLAINGDPRAAALGYSHLINVRGGETYRVDVERQGQRVSVDVLLPLVGGRYLWPIFQVCGLAFFICGAALGLLRPQDQQVRFVSLLLMSAGFTALQEALGGVRLFLVGWERSAHLALTPVYLFFAPMTYHFFSRFPTWRRPGPPWRSIQWVLYALLLLFGPARVLSFMGFYDITERSTEFFVAHPWVFLTSARVDRAVFAYMGACLILALVVAARNYRHLPDPGSRRRSRWVMASLITACGPVGITFAFETMAWVSRATWELVYPPTERAIVEGHRAADHGGIAGVFARPERVTEDDRARGIDPILLGQERAAQGRCRAKQGEELVRDRRRQNPAPLAVGERPGERHVGREHGGEPREDAAPRLSLAKVPMRNLHDRLRACEILPPRDHERRWLSKWQGRENHGIQCHEDRRRRPDRQRERDDGRECERRLPAQRPQPVA